MKRIISLACIFLLLLTVSACGATSEPNSTVQRKSTAETGTEPPGMTESPAEEAGAAEQEEIAMKISVQSEQHEIIYELNDSTAARELYAQLPLTIEVEPFSNNEMTFYPE